ncbi:MAG: hypothetical protein ACAI34_20515 [Verrucomicrobium sp.]
MHKPTTPGGRRVAVTEDLGLNRDQLSHVTTQTPDKARTWHARPWRQEKAELAGGATAGGVGFTKFLSGSANAFKLGASTSAQVGVALGAAGAGFGLVDAGIAVVAYKKASRFQQVWGGVSKDQNLDKAAGIESRMKAFRGKGPDAAKNAPPDVRFAIDPKGVGSDGRSHLSKLSPSQQQDQLTRIARYAEAKCDRKMTRKTVEGTLSTLAAGFGIAALATAAFPPLGAAFGILSLGFGIARGVCTLAKSVNGAAKRGADTLGQAREQNAKGLYELATNKDSDPSVRNKARETLSKLGIDMTKVPDPTSSLEQQDSVARHRDEVVLNIMLTMKS